MSFIVTPAAAAAPDVPTLRAANDAGSASERSSTFGPALSDARQRLANPDARRPDPVERSDRPEDPSRGEPAERSESPRSESPRSDSQRPEAADAAASDDTSVDHGQNDVAGDEVAVAPSSSTADAAHTVDESSEADEAAMAAALLAAGGALPEADPVIDLTTDAPMTSEPAEETPDVETAGEVDTSVITDGVTEVDIEAITGSTGEEAAPEVAEMGRQAALTSLEQVSDADLSLADRIRPATTEEVAGPSISLDEADRADPFSQLPGDETAAEAPLQGRIDEANTTRAEAVNTPTTSEEAPDTAGVDGPSVQPDTVDRPVQQAAINTVAQSDNPDAVVVLAREAAAPTESVKAAVATSPQSTPTLPPTVEANLWEDVRSAFDRVRSTGDGQELLMRLRPAELGELLVQVRTQGDHVSVRLVTSSAAAQQTLVDDRLRLAAELARAGFDEGSVDIGQSNTGDANQRGDQNGDGSDADRTGQPFGTATGLGGIGTTRDVFERRDPIRTESGFRPGRTAQSTINLTL